ncbi:heptosyltransferase [Flavobacterium suaedae]|uniref:Heptosyltransferase n=2 Tax=Flavobacterium suaedae TaxID=1767027 RepID=A0ABQ1JY05_9FLAO|nr:heptosyltransferase [Flavobacterium suaedae]
MGDVAITVPVIRALISQHKNVKVTVVSRAFFKPFFNGIPRLDFFAAEPKGRHKGLLGIFKLYSELKELRIYAVADLHNVLRSKLLTKLFKMKGKPIATLDKARDKRAALVRSEDKVFEPLIPVVQRYAEVFEKLGVPVDLNTIEFPEKQELTQDVLSVTGEHNQKWIGVAPFAKHRAKVYPKDLMQEVITSLALNKNNKLFLFGAGKAEISRLNKFAQKHGNVVVIAGKMALKQELQLISNLDVMISMDSGNAHIAAMYGVNVVTLWGATHPYAGFAPFNQPAGNALTVDRKKYPKIPTSIYGNKKVDGYEDAMRTIKPLDVVNTVNKYL